MPGYELSPLLEIKNLLSHGELPTAKACTLCNQDTDETVEVTAECEKSWIDESSGILQSLGVLMMGLGGILLRFKEQPDREVGRNVILHLPVKTCHRCVQQLLPGPVALIWGLLAMMLSAAGLVVMVAWSAWGAVLLACPILVVWAEWSAKKRTQTALRKLLECEPAYRRLLNIYPGARLVMHVD